ncbi:oxidoreductase [Streptomyces sp. NPDC051567]|uniref:oxidoreductase n=1 Tax=Streptomyces sp. NPDC051567 TaxID=3365660 RepID=UPI0037B79685
MGWSAEDIPDLRGRTALITGGSAGLGLETARVLAARGARVVIACRDTARGRAVADGLGGRAQVVRLDLASLESVREAAAEVRRRHDRLDLLVNNAGVMFPAYRRTKDGYEAHFGVNHLGHFALTGLLLGLLQEVPGSRVVTMASLAHKAAVGGGGLDRARAGTDRRSVVAYGRSKLANLLFARELQRRLAASGSAAVSVAAHPGLSATALWSGDAPGWLRLVSGAALRWLGQPPAQAALPVLRAAADPLVPGGSYLGPGGFQECRGAPVRVGSSRAAQDLSAQARLWELSQELTGVRYGGADASAAAAVEAGR